jgi:hypothetical protein
MAFPITITATAGDHFRSETPGGHVKASSLRELGDRFSNMKQVEQIARVTRRSGASSGSAGFQWSHTLSVVPSRRSLCLWHRARLPVLEPESTITTPQEFGPVLYSFLICLADLHLVAGLA